MGSLMSGWDAPIHDPQKVKCLTTEEIEAFWRTKKKIEEEHLKAAISCAAAQFDRFTPQKGGLKPDCDSFSMDNHLINKDTCWWTHSKWAFLNEPPMKREGLKHTYESQLHIASRFASTTNRPITT